MSQTTELIVRLKQVGGEQLTQLSSKLRNLGQQSAAASTDFRRLADDLRRVQSTSVQSINNLKGYATAWREIANSVDIASKEFKEANAEANKLEKQLGKIQPSGRGGLGRAAQVAGTIAGAGVFGGFEGAAGAAIGGLVGGVPGAITGGAIGAQVGALRQQAALIAENVASINKYRIALAGVSKDQDDYGRSIESVNRFSRAFLLPLGQATEQYTRLKASIVGAGFGTQETDRVFQAISASIIATGGNAEKLNAALNATSQVFSKGKVSAEELRQQIGERLPGAFTIFAQSLGKTPAELDKALEDGKVTLQDFLTFSEELYKRYGSTAEILATAPENAGARLKVALDAASVTFGGFFQVVGAGFQNLISGALNWALNNEEAIKRVVTVFAIGFNELGKIVGGFAKFLVGVFNTAFTTLLGNLDTVLRRVEAAINRAKAVQSLTPQRIGQFQEQAKRATESRFGLLTPLRASEASAFYNQYFENLIDQATKSAGAQKYTDRVGKILFPEFTPSAFGAGVGPGVVAGAGAGGDAAGGKRAKSAKEIVDRTAEELALIKEINQAERNNQTLRAAAAQFKLAELEVEIALERKAIGRNQAIEKLEEAETRYVKTVEASFRGFGSQVIKLLEGQQKINEAVQDLEIRAGILNEKEAKRIEQQRFINQLQQDGVTLTDQLLARINAAFAKLGEKLTGTRAIAKSFADVVKSMGELSTNLGQSFGNAFTGMADQLSEFVVNGKLEFADFARSVLADLSKIFLRFALFQTLKAIIPGGSALGKFLGFANGGIMTKDGPLDLRRYASGGIASSPQVAVFGEGSRPEAFVPLPDGRTIPVTIKDGSMGGASIVVNVDAQGSQVSGNEGQAKALGTVVSAAVQAEIVKQQRPGGLLSGTR